MLQRAILKWNKNKSINSEAALCDVFCGVLKSLVNFIKTIDVIFSLRKVLKTTKGKQLKISKLQLWKK
jgi:hypothetical protein